MMDGLLYCMLRNGAPRTILGLGPLKALIRPCGYDIESDMHWMNNFYSPQTL